MSRPPRWSLLELGNRGVGVCLVLDRALETAPHRCGDLASLLIIAGAHSIRGSFTEISFGEKLPRI